MGAEAEVVVVGHGNGVEVAHSAAWEDSKAVSLGQAVGGSHSAGATVAASLVGTSAGAVLQPATNTNIRTPAKCVVKRIALAVMIGPTRAFGAGSVGPPQGFLVQG